MIKMDNIGVMAMIDGNPCSPMMSMVKMKPAEESMDSHQPGCFMVKAGNDAWKWRCSGANGKLLPAVTFDNGDSTNLQSLCHCISTMTNMKERTIGIENTNGTSTLVIAAPRCQSIALFMKTESRSNWFSKLLSAYCSSCQTHLCLILQFVLRPEQEQSVPFLLASFWLWCWMCVQQSCACRRARWTQLPQRQWFKTQIWLKVSFAKWSDICSFHFWSVGACWAPTRRSKRYYLDGVGWKHPSLPLAASATVRQTTTSNGASTMSQILQKKSSLLLLRTLWTVTTATFSTMARLAWCWALIGAKGPLEAWQRFCLSAPKTRKQLDNLSYGCPIVKVCHVDCKSNFYNLIKQTVAFTLNTSIKQLQGSKTLILFNELQTIVVAYLIPLKPSASQLFLIYNYKWVSLV